MSAEQIINNLNKIKSDLEPVILKVLQQEAYISIDKNFQEQGRPNKWKKKKRDDGRAILTGKTGNLRRIVVNIVKDGVIIGNNPTTDKYARTHQEGKGKIPMRKFLVIPDIDFPRIKNMISLAVQRFLNKFH